MARIETYHITYADIFEKGKKYRKWSFDKCLELCIGVANAHVFNFCESTAQREIEKIMPYQIGPQPF